MEPKIIREKISKGELMEITKENFDTMVKVDVDVVREILTIGGEWHSEGDEILSKDGSSREDVWGINFYPWNLKEKRIEYVSLINIKPQFNNRSMKVENKQIRENIRMIVNDLLLNENETI